MRASTAYFVGAGTIVAAIAIGLGGGIVAGNIMNPVAPKQGPDTGRMERRAEAAAIPANASVTTNASSERVQYLTGSQAFGTVIAAPAQAEATKPETQANAEPAAPQPSQAAAVEPPKEPLRPTPAAPAQVVKPAEQRASTEPSSSLDNAYAKARESDVKRAASEQRRMDRRERWADRHQYDARAQSGMRDRTDWDDVARNVRADSDARDVASRPRSGAPRMMLFGRDDD